MKYSPNTLIMRILTVSALIALTASLILGITIETEPRVLAETESETELALEEYVKDYEDNLYVLSHVINGEACGCSWEMKIGVGSVVLNRVHSDTYPDTIRDVVFQDGQYACTWDGNYDREPEDEAVKAAEYLLRHGSQYPEEVVYQANFTQGSGVYEIIGNMYFCY